MQIRKVILLNYQNDYVELKLVARNFWNYQKLLHYF